MAVTLQLARLTPSQLDLCRQSVPAIDDLCSFRMLDPGEYLDLNWAGMILEELAVRSEVRPALRRRLALALSGGAEVNPAYREAPDTIWEHPVTCLAFSEVRDVADALAELSHLGFPRERDIEDCIDAQPYAGWSGPAGDAQAQFERLREFYAAAATRELCMSMWWD